MLGKSDETLRGFAIVKFDDCYGIPCSLQQSSAWDGESEPGHSFIWLGTDDAKPQCLHGDAKRLGVKANATEGWVQYPIPPEVQLSTRMHLNREQVQSLVEHLQSWLSTGSFS